MVTRRLQAVRCSRSSELPVPMETGLGYCPPSLEHQVGSLLCLIRFLPQPSSNRPYSFLLTLSQLRCKLISVADYTSLTAPDKCSCSRSLQTLQQVTSAVTAGKALPWLPSTTQGRGRAGSLQALHTLPLLQHSHHRHSTSSPLSHPQQMK